MMVLGIALHSAMTYMTIAIPVWPFRDPFQSHVCDVLTLFIHSFRMPLFFVLAGFFGAMVHGRAGAVGFLRQRAQRILLPFVAAWLLLYAPTLAGMVYGMGALGPNPWGDVAAFFRSGAYYTPLRTLHLWFLHYLVHVYVLAVALAYIVPRVTSPRFRARFQDGFRRAAASVWRVPLLALPTAATLYFMESGGLESSATFLVTLPSLLAFSIYFGFGWLLFGHSDLIQDFRRHAWAQAGAAVALLPVNAIATGETVHALPRYAAVPHTVAIVSASLIAWLFIFAFIGLAQRYLSAANPRARYVADASYWMYLIHLPVVLWIQAALVPWAVSGVLKFAIVTSLTTAITLWTYALFVRNRFIGTVLNGRRPS
jgi:glucan biosynthesis protein C